MTKEIFQISCLYHPIDGMRVFDNADDYFEALKKGTWFKHPNEAKEVKEGYEKRSKEKIKEKTRKKEEININELSSKNSESVNN